MTKTKETMGSQNQKKSSLHVLWMSISRVFSKKQKVFMGFNLFQPPPMG
jgi:hypothetical protein